MKIQEHNGTTIVTLIDRDDFTQEQREVIAKELRDKLTSDGGEILVYFEPEKEYTVKGGRDILVGTLLGILIAQAVLFALILFL